MNTDLASPLGEEPNRKTHKQPKHDHGAGDSRPKWIPSRQECLAQIATLSGLVAVKKLAPAAANTIRANLIAIIREQDRDVPGRAESLSDNSVREMWRADPRLLSLVEHLLTPEQIDQFMREAGDQHEPQA